MKRTASAHRNRQRKIFRWSLALAVLAHAVLFVALPDLDVEPLEGSGTRAVDLTSADQNPSTLLDVSFGPPSITGPDGEVRVEPADRTLRTKRLAELPPLCLELAVEGQTPLEGSVRLAVGPAGYAQVVNLVASTGTTCGDLVIRSVAGSLRYHWLPDDRFSAPVDLVQPVTLLEVLQ